MTSVVILLGTNLGDRLLNLKKADLEIGQRIGLVLMRSMIYQTKPWGNTEQDDFLNQVLVIDSSKKANEILSALLELELEMGRKRTKQWEPRIIDLDILYFGDEIIETKDLKIPHPFIQERRFTLVPLAEILPAMIHPVFKQSNYDLLLQTTDHSSVIIYEH